MMSPSSDSDESQAAKPEQAGQAKKPKPDWMNQIDVELAFRLIDSILPFEACLYHQILPLSLEGSRLKLGMVNVDDSAALDYVRRILAYMNCSLVPQSLTSDIHYAALSAYLQHADQQKKAVNSSTPPVARRIAQKLAEQSSKRVAEGKVNPAADPHTNPTLLVDSPTELPFVRSAPPAEPPVSVASPRSQTPLMGVSQDSDTVIFSQPFESTSSAVPDDLDIHPQHLSEAPEALLSLASDTLLEELLGRILSWGIGRLYLEQRVEHGRILWSQNGVLQAVLEELPTSTLNGVIQELKQLTNLSAALVQKTKQVEIEKRYQGRPLLLRLRLMPGRYGEEATLQVLRGAALSFYRQQQLVNLAQEAMGMAQKLQQKVNEMAAYSRNHAVVPPEHLGIYPELDRVLKRIGYQIADLQTMQPDESGEDE
jgi:type II secretory ATPase GspE/PulE/Tfp pilus assembly ATPase PilB-like protein